MWQLGKMQLNKVNKSLTYPTTMNYWAPLLDKIDKTEAEHEEMNAIITKQLQPEAKTNKWTQQIIKQQEKHLEMIQEQHHFF
jgi:hypothetical protein